MGRELGSNNRETTNSNTLFGGKFERRSLGSRGVESSGLTATVV